MFPGKNRMNQKDGTRLLHLKVWRGSVGVVYKDKRSISIFFPVSTVEFGGILCY